MKLIRVLLIGVLALPGASAASKEIVELQRDVALLQEQLRTLQSSQDQKIASLQTLMQQTLDTVNRLNTSIALLGNNIENTASKQTPAVANMNSRLDQMAQSFNDLRDNVQDLSSRIGKIDAAIADAEARALPKGETALEGVYCGPDCWWGKAGVRSQKSEV